MKPSTVHDPLVLLIDDSIVEQRLLVELLTRKNYRLAIAHNGMDGYRKALLNRPELILLDVQMRGIDGFGVCKMLKSNPATQNIPVIFLTASNEPEQRLQGLMLGAVDYIPKPFSTDEEVLARVRLHVSAEPRAQCPPPRTLDQMDQVQQIPLPEGLSIQIRLAIDYLTRDLINAPSPTQLARLLGTNETTLNDAFRRELNLPIFAYLREERLRRARKLIIESDIPIRLIGEHVGYVHPGNFTTAFRLRYGVTPREVRKFRTAADTLGEPTGQDE